MKSFFRFILFIFLFSFFGCLGILDESLYQSVSLEIKIPENIENQNSRIERNVTTENLKLVIDLEIQGSEKTQREEKNVSLGSTVQISFDEIPVESKIRLIGNLFDSEGTVLYSGETEWQTIQVGNNSVDLKMKKVIIEDESNKDEKPSDEPKEEHEKVPEEEPKEDDVIVDAAVPIVSEVSSFVFVKDVDETSKTLNCSATSTDDGVITFQWQVQNINGEWENIESTNEIKAHPEYESLLSVSVENFDINEVKNYKCIVTNTNDKVNGTKITSVEKTATIAYVEGTLTSFTAEYIGDYEIFGSDFNYEKVTVTETWVSEGNSFKISVPASRNRYKIEKQNSNFIGNVPYSISYIDGGANEDALKQDLVIPVKYKLDTQNLKLSSSFNGVCLTENIVDEKIQVPQYGTLNVEYFPTDFEGELTIKNDAGQIVIKNLTNDNNGPYYSATIKKGNETIENGASCNVVGEFAYAVTLKSENEWFICEEEKSKVFEVVVYAWEMSVEVTYQNNGTKTASKNSDGNYVVPVDSFYVSATVNINGIAVSLSKEINGTDSNQVISFGVGEESLAINVKFGNNVIGTVTVVKESQTISQSITYVGVDTETNLHIFNIYDATGLATFRDIVNGNLETSVTIPADSSVSYGASYNVTNTSGLSLISAVLKADIDLGSYDYWEPITGPSKEEPFCGDFDGNGKIIKNLKSNQGLFGVIDCTLANRFATIKNLKVQTSIESANSNIGGIAGYAYNVKFINCKSSGVITSSGTEVGGIVGYADSCEFENCVNDASVSSTAGSGGNNSVGGIAGFIKNVSASKCLNSGNISGETAVGGLFGYEKDSEAEDKFFEYCINTGSVTSTSYFGGILGYATESLKFNLCANYGNLYFNNGNIEVGCLIGRCSNSVSVNECLSVGAVSSNDLTYYAIGNNVSVENSYFDSDVLSNCKDSTIDGLTGISTAEITNGNHLEKFNDDYWVYGTGRYPIPNVESDLSDYWNVIVQGATPTTSN